MAEVVTVERRTGADAVITLNRPAARNAMNAELAAGTVRAMHECADSRAIVLTGADPAFCAGLDLRDLGVDALGDLEPFIGAVADSPVPVIAAVNGPAVTGGLELALACDFIVASDRARFADTHLRVGVYPGPVLVTLPRRVGIAWAREMSLTGNFVDAETALRIGLANHVVPHAELLPWAIGLGEAIAEVDPSMVRAARQDWALTDGLVVADAHAAHEQFAREHGFRTNTGKDIAAHREEVIARARHQAGVTSRTGSPAQPGSP